MIFKNDKSNSRGVTLIETLIYLALFAVIMSGLMASAYMLYAGADQSQTKAMLQEEENFIIGKIAYAMSQAQAICNPAPGFPGGTLSISFDAVCGGNHDITIAKSGGDVEWGVDALNNSNVTIDNLVFTRTYAGGANPDKLEIALTASALTPIGRKITIPVVMTRYIRK